MGALFPCCRTHSVLSDEMDDHALISDANSKSEIKAVVGRNRRAGHTMPLMEDSRLLFRDTVNGHGESSASDDNLGEILPMSPDLVIYAPEKSNGSSDDEGGVAGEMDSSDDS
jgi:hypothetical protein